MTTTTYTRLVTRCPARHGEPHRPHGGCQGRAPEFPSETVYDVGTCGHLTADGLVPWAGERLCWNCADAQLDLLAKAMQSEDNAARARPGGTGRDTGHYHDPAGRYDYCDDPRCLRSAPRTPSQDELAAALAADLIRLANGSLERLGEIERALGMESTWAGDEAADAAAEAAYEASYAPTEGDQGGLQA